MRQRVHAPALELLDLGVHLLLELAEDQLAGVEVRDRVGIVGIQMIPLRFATHIIVRLARSLILCLKLTMIVRQ